MNILETSCLNRHEQVINITSMSLDITLVIRVCQNVLFTLPVNGIYMHCSSCLQSIKYIKFLNKCHFKISMPLHHFQDKIISILHSIQCPLWPFSAGLNPRTCPKEQLSFTELEIPQTNYHFSTFAHAISFAVNV